ncbi:MAG: DUF2852 domain-containing protein [Granulosicoccus sp.]
MSSATKSGVRPCHIAPSHRWSGTNIAVMVLGFVMFWPLGLVILAWIMMGRDVRDLPGAIKGLWYQFFSGGSVESRFTAGSDNIVFNEYQQTQYDRISEIKNEIRERARRFKDFSMDAKRRADQDEFDRFMSSAPDSRG